ncbi:Diaminopimelate epimerase-like protein [Patellaria atrata CBS 101060]|uniref:Diaminopimelate epimerase-like protein n=1 Tax=Patellaria atrata CBS 101060 TaxID=1346257 RepID=A0A9P4S4S6_9PEZI|nr:Diaminopimelate epimerase-like protein [Patellaria atrata CBS 101060]
MTTLNESLLLDYVTLDVFTRDIFAGNPLAVVKVPKTVTLRQDQKQVIAREFNYSETVFLHEQKDGEPHNEWIIDIFLTNAEVPFAGHPTIGTACHILPTLAIPSRNVSHPQKTIEGSFLTRAGKIGLAYDPDTHVAKALLPHNVHVHKSTYSGDDLSRFQPTLAREHPTPSHSAVVSIVKGMTFVLVRLGHEHELAAVTTTSLPVECIRDEEWDEGFVGTYFFVEVDSSDNGTRNLRTRMIEGSLEDPATGSAASALAAFLSMKDGKPGDTVKFAITQGVEIGRKSHIGVEVSLAKQGIEAIRLSGTAVPVMEGKLRV